MRFLLPALLPVAFLFTSCANEGVIVRKDSNPMPFYESIGVDGSYKLALRDNAGAVHSQLVTPEVFEGYAEGQYFNDASPAPAAAGKDETTAIPEAAAIRPQTLTHGRSLSGNRIAARKAGSSHGHAVAKVHQATTAHPVASVKTSPAPSGSVLSKAESTVTAHFSVAKMPPSSAQPLASSAGTPALAPTLSAKLQTAPPVHAVAATAPQKPVVISAAKPMNYSAVIARQQIAAKQTRVVASLSAPAGMISRPAAVGRAVVTKAPAKNSTVASAKNLQSTQGAKRVAVQTSQKKAAAASKSASAKQSDSQVAFISAARGGGH